MSVTERVMAAGTWSVQLSPETPRRLLELIDIEKSAFGQIVILPAHLDPRSHTDAGMLAVARYSGIYRRQEGDFRLSGPGLPILLGDEDGKGDVFETPRETANGYLTQWVTELRPLSLAAGTVYSPGGSYDGSMHLITAKEALERLGVAFDVEWRITPAFKLDVGHPDSLYGATPGLLILHNAGDGGRDLSPIPASPSSITPLVGVTTVGAGWDRDYEDYTTKIVYVTEEEIETNTQVVTNQGSINQSWVWDPVLEEDVLTDVSINSPTKDTITERDKNVIVTTAFTSDANIPFGRPTDGAPVILDRTIEAGEDDGSTPSQMANVQLGRFNKVRRELYVDGGRVDLGHLSPVGSYVWLYAPPVVMDTGTSVHFRGRACYPVRTRIVGMTWPIMQGYGVYLRTTRNATVWHDLTDYVMWEDGETKLEVGAPPRSTD